MFKGFHGLSTSILSWSCNERNWGESLKVILAASDGKKTAPSEFSRNQWPTQNDRQDNQKEREYYKQLREHMHHQQGGKKIEELRIARDFFHFI